VSAIAVAKEQPLIMQRLGEEVPNPRQAEFFSSIGRHIAYGGARGGGKSWAVRRKCVMMAMRYAGLKILLLRRTLPELRENHIQPLLAELTGFAKYNDTDKTFTFPNGSRLVLGYCDAEKDVYRYQGQEYEIVCFEEATHFTESQIQFLWTCNRSTRRDIKPRCYYTANPGNVGHQWFKRLFIDRIYQGMENPDDFVFIPAKVYDNTVLMESNPEYVKTLEALPEDMRRAMLDGDWDVFAGQYFPEFRREIHVIKPFNMPDYWHRFRSLDYGLDMTACYWWAVDTHGKCYIYRELHQPGLTLSQAASKILEMTPDSENISYTVASPDLWARRQETGQSGMEIMIKAGMTGLRRADNARVPGWRALREYLIPYKDEFELMTARLLIFDHCTNLTRCLPLLQHDEHNPEDAADKPHDITHGPESCRYGISSRPRLSSTPQSPISGTYAYGELKMLGYSDTQIKRMDKVKIIGEGARRRIKKKLKY
jgi:phage terminase large subunit